MLTFRIRTIVYKEGLYKVPRILSKHLKVGLLTVGKRLAKSAQSRMRKDTGKERDSLKIEVKGRGTQLKLTVYSTLIQAKVDARGLPVGIFPPFAPGSNLYKWARRKVSGRASQRVEIKGTVPKMTKKQISQRNKQRSKIKYIRPIQLTEKPRGKRTRALNRNAGRFAFVTARKIFRQGIRGTKWNKRALEANRTRIIREMKNALSRAIQEMKKA